MSAKALSQTDMVRRHYYWVDMVSILLGCVLLSEFFVLVSQRFFSLKGFHMRLEQLLKFNAFESWHILLTWLMKHGSIIAPLFALIMALTSIALILLVARKLALLMSTLIFLAYYVSHLHYPGNWVFEYLMPLLISACVLIANLVRQSPGKLWHQPQRWLQILLIIISAALLWYVTFLGEFHQPHVIQAASNSAICLAILLFALVLLDHRRAIPDPQTIIVENRLVTLPWVDIITIIIGAMLVFQVYEDHMLKWFTVSGYKGLTQQYHAYTHAPSIINYFIQFSGEHAKIFMPIQVVIESFTALMLVILVLRTPFILIALLLFSLLTYIEFGLPVGHISMTPHPTTWTWELLFTTCLTLFAAIFNISKLLASNPVEFFKLGTSVFGELNYVTRIVIAALSGLLLWAFVILSGAQGAQNGILAIESGLTLFFYMVLLGIIDYGRPKLP